MRCCVAASLTVGTFEAGECAVRVQSCWLKRHLTCCSLLCMPACFTKRDVVCVVNVSGESSEKRKSRAFMKCGQKATSTSRHLSACLKRKLLQADSMFLGVHFRCRNEISRLTMRKTRHGRGTPEPAGKMRVSQIVPEKCPGTDKRR